MAITCTIDATGIHAPTLAEIRAYLVAQYQGIYGADVYLESDSQDGQLLDLFATSIHDANAMTVAAYGAFSPSTAQGAGLSSVVKINGIARNIASNSNVDLLLGGTAGTTITNGYATDDNSVHWMLPASVTIPSEGQITVTATAADVGAIAAAPNTITGIGTPTRGWQTVTNPAAATEGLAVETDSQLRRRQAVSTALPSKSVGDGLLGDVLSLTGVARAKLYDNDTGSVDENGIPGHHIALVVDGGDAIAVASKILLRKGPGAGTYGTTTEVVDDSYGMPRTIHFFRPTDVPISIAITVRALAGYTSAIGDSIKASLVSYINALDIGADVLLTRLYVPANLSNGTGAYDITSLLIARDDDSPSGSNITIAYNEAASCVVGDIALSVI